jgi:hypothetical protein
MRKLGQKPRLAIFQSRMTLWAEIFERRGAPDYYYSIIPYSEARQLRRIRQRAVSLWTLSTAISRQFNPF